MNYSNSRGPSFGSRDGLDVSTMDSHLNPRLGSVDLGKGFISLMGREGCYFTGTSPYLMDELEVHWLEDVNKTI